MAIKAGVWIDHYKAVVVVIADSGEVTTEIRSRIDPAGRSERDTGSRHSYRRPEDKQEHKFMNQLNAYYDEVLLFVHDAESILIFGPGEAKGEFRKRLQSKQLSGQVRQILAVESADKMSDHQIAASVRQHFVTA